MSYQKNVQDLCDRLGIDNPINEENLTIQSLRFWVDGAGLFIPGTDMNRAGRLFFQDEIPQGCLGAYLRCPGRNKPEPLYERARQYFDERWDDAEEMGRSLIVALKSATKVEVHWKE